MHKKTVYEKGINLEYRLLLCNLYYVILHEQLGMKKLSARWVPRLLTVDHKRDRVTISKQCLEMFQRNPDEFLRRFIIVDDCGPITHTRRRNSQNNGHRVNQLRRRRRP